MGTVKGARPARVVVLGGGIAGLAAAHGVRRQAPPDTVVTLVEAADRLGGKLRTEDFAGLPLDTGADAFRVGVPEALDLARDAGLGAELVHPAATGAHVLVRGVPRPLPAGTVLGVPTALRPLARSGLLSPTALLRASADAVLPGEPVVGDVTVGALVTRRLGRAVVDRLVDPLLGGVYAGRADELSLDATMPALAPEVRRHRSLLRAARAARGPGGDGPVFASLPAGTGRLVEAVAAACRPLDVRTGTAVVGLDRLVDGWQVRLSTGGSLPADAVVVALPAAPTAALLRDVAPRAAGALARIDYASVAVVGLAYRRTAWRLPDVGSGFLVPRGEGRLMTACTVSSAKWAHLAMPDRVVVRCSVGRVGEEEAALTLDDADLAGRLHDELGASTERPLAWRVSRWPQALPQYAVGHLDRAAEIEAAVAVVPGLAVAGAAYRGVGIPACIRSGQRAAAEVVRHLADATLG